MKEEKYNWEQIKQCVKDIYEVEATPDSWGIKVIYEESMLKYLQRRLKRIKQYIN